MRKGLPVKAGGSEGGRGKGGMPGAEPASTLEQGADAEGRILSRGVNSRVCLAAA